MRLAAVAPEAPMPTHGPAPSAMYLLKRGVPFPPLSPSWQVQPAARPGSAVHELESWVVGDALPSLPPAKTSPQVETTAAIAASPAARPVALRNYAR